MDHPVASWKPKTPAPDFGAVAWKLQSRWTAGVVKTPVYTATSKSSKMFGGRGGKRLKLSFHATHDLGVSQMFLNLRRNDADKAATWIGEDDLAPFRYRQKLPDAVLAKAPDQRPRLVLEFGGSYDKQRVEAFHRDCQKRHLPYEIW
ncbi:hypothetical protein Poly51_17430 [Rubripirellula tenax]|nr:hypothetical protein Poly51_17430 [Rubripirellula tenax]